MRNVLYFCIFASSVVMATFVLSDFFIERTFYLFLPFLDFRGAIEYHSLARVTLVTSTTWPGESAMREREAIRWLQLTYKVPSEPSQKRVWVWRRLQNLGAFALQNSVYLLPFSEEVEKQFRQLAHDIRAMDGEASIFLVFALDPADEQRILQSLIEARSEEYDAVISLCASFLARARDLFTRQRWDDQLHAEFAEILEKVHVLFRSAKRHDLLASLTATKRAAAAESLALCEQIFRLLLDRDYARARRTFEAHQDLFPAPENGDTPSPLTSLFVTSERKYPSNGE
jgi:CRISPR/Cas system-associated endoribonuclease Cas2